jgi:tripartite ATP-independent transporter DctM subunit
MSLVILFVFFGVALLGMPLAFSLGLSAIAGLLVSDVDLNLLPSRMMSAVNAFPLMSIPFFILAGELMLKAGMMERLIDLANAAIGRVRGGLGHVTIFAGLGLSTVSGAAVADASALGSTLLPSLKKHYGVGFSAAICAAAANLGPIIPPSGAMIVYAFMAGPSVSVGGLFMAGIVPGVLIALVQMATVHVYAKLRNYPTYPRATLLETLKAILVSVPALMTPVIIIGGKVFGWFTATESACIAVLYAAALTMLVYREMDLKGLHQALLDTGRLTGVALFAVGTASAFGWLLAYYQIPKALLANVAAWGMGPVTTGFFIAAVFLVVGCFLDAIPAIVIVGTVLEPLARSVGMDPIHFAMIGIVSLAFGLVTPPYGLCLLISAHVAGIRIVDALKDVMIMLLPMLAVLALVIMWPDLVLFLPKLFPPGTL